MKHVSSITYYPQGNGQVESTNKFIVNLITNLNSENKVDLDEHLLTMFFSYKITYKVATWYTPYQLVYVLHPLMPTKYVLLTFSEDHKNANIVKEFINQLIGLEKLQNDRLHVEKTIGNQHWNCVMWSQQKYPEKKLKFGDHVL